MITVAGYTIVQAHKFIDDEGGIALGVNKNGEYATWYYRTYDAGRFNHGHYNMTRLQGVADYFKRCSEHYE